jgi:hypothetical protein
MGLGRKLEALRSLRPDIAVLSEVACPEKLLRNVPEFCGLPIVWVGDNPNKDLLSYLSRVMNSLSTSHTEAPTNTSHLFM